MAANMAVGNRSGSVVWGMVTIMLVLLCGGCSLIVGTLPEPDPIWKAAVGGPYNTKTKCAGAWDDIWGGEEATECLTPEQRIRQYLATLLPASPNEFAESLKKIGATCSVLEDMWGCSYTKARASRPCDAVSRANISIWFSRSVPKIDADMLKIKSLTVRDTEMSDTRSCFF